jgi:uncharacterized protein (UPF0248 family)
MLRDSPISDASLIQMGPREALNKLKWHSKFTLRDSKITIAHRGAPRNIRIIDGVDIIELGHSFMRVTSPEGEVEIPYHRIIQIEVQGKIFWQKRG